MTRLGLPALPVGNARTGVVFPNRSVRVSVAVQPRTVADQEAAAWAEQPVSGLIVGTVDRDIDPLENPSASLSWASVGIPTSYDGSSALPTPPTGYGWLYLGDASSSGYGPWSPFAVGDVAPLITTRGVSAFRLLRAFIDIPYTNKDAGFTRPSGIPGASKSTLYLVFSSRVGTVRVRDIAISGSDTTKERLLPLNTYTLSAFTNVITVQLNREVSEDEVVAVTVSREVQSSNGYMLAGEASAHVFFRHPRYQYLLCRNASSGTISEGARVVVSRIEWESDTTNSVKGTRPVAIVTQVGSGGSSGTSLCICQILGGNAYTSSAVRPLSLPLPLDPSAPIEYPTVSDWSKYDLPATWAPGDTTPQLPSGLCFVKIARPGTLGSALWYGDLPGDVESVSASTSVPTFLTATAISPYTSIRVALSVSDAAINSQQAVPPGVTVISSNPALQKIKPLRVSVSGKYLTITLSRALQPLKEVVSVALPQNLMKRKAASMYYMSPAFRAQVGIKSVASTAVYALNRWAMQVYQAGDLVVVDKKAITLTDLKGATRVVYDILHSATPGVRPHTHSLVATPPIYGVSNVL